MCVGAFVLCGGCLEGERDLVGCGFGMGFFVVVKNLCVSVFWFVTFSLVELCLLMWYNCHLQS